MSEDLELPTPSFGKQGTAALVSLLLIVVGGLGLLAGLMAWLAGAGPWIAAGGAGAVIAGMVLFKVAGRWMSGSIEDWARQVTGKLEVGGVIDAEALKRMEAGEASGIRPGDDSSPEALAERWTMALSQAPADLATRMGADQLTARTLAAGLPAEIFEIQLKFNLGGAEALTGGQWKLGSYEGDALMLDMAKKGALVKANPKGDIFVNTSLFQFARSMAAFVEIMSETADVPDTAKRLGMRLISIDAPAMTNPRNFWARTLAEIQQMEADDQVEVA